MEWSEEATRKLRQVLALVPVPLRARAEDAARREAEAHARSNGATQVDVDAMVIGYIHATPGHLRSGLRLVLDAAGINTTKYDAHFE